MLIWKYSLLKYNKTENFSDLVNRMCEIETAKRDDDEEHIRKLNSGGFRIENHHNGLV